jgi:hypothetical protein
MPYTSTDQELPDRLPKFYECGICGAWHSLAWDGDCREDGARFFADELDAKYGMMGWESVLMPGGEDAD